VVRDAERPFVGAECLRKVGMLCATGLRDKRLCEKRKGKIKRKIRVIRVKRDRHAQDGTLTFN